MEHFTKQSSIQCRWAHIPPPPPLDGPRLSSMCTSIENGNPCIATQVYQLVMYCTYLCTYVRLCFLDIILDIALIQRLPKLEKWTIYGQDVKSISSAVSVRETRGFWLLRSRRFWLLDGLRGAERESGEKTLDVVAMHRPERSGRVQLARRTADDW